jgi:hypothetical protein
MAVERIRMKRNRTPLRTSKKALLRKVSVKVAKHHRRYTTGLVGRSLRSDRRHETRRRKISPCTYGLMRLVGRDGAILEEGQGAAVNKSSTGMRLLLGIAPSKGQLLEIQAGPSLAGPGLCLVEVCWTKPLRSGVQGALYLVGCRQNFGITYDEAV